MKETYKKFYKKLCQVELKNGFNLYGIVSDINPDGIFLTTDEKTSFIAWDSIELLLPKRDV